MNSDQINIAKRFMLRKVNSNEFKGTKNVEIRDIEDNLIPFFHVGIPPKSKIKKFSDCKRIPSIGDWTSSKTGRQKKKRKVAGGANSNTVNEFSKLVQRRPIGSKYHNSLESEVDIIHVKRQHTCSFCKKIGHTYKDCSDFCSYCVPVQKDTDRIQGNYAFLYFCLPDLGTKSEENLDDLKKPPVDIAYVPNNVDDNDLVSYKQITPSIQSRNREKNESSGDNDVSFTTEYLHDAVSLNN